MTVSELKGQKMRQQAIERVDNGIREVLIYKLKHIHAKQGRVQEARTARDAFCTLLAVDPVLAIREQFRKRGFDTQLNVQTYKTSFDLVAVR